jgi:hypothetical protein
MIEYILGTLIVFILIQGMRLSNSMNGVSNSIYKFLIFREEITIHCYYVDTFEMGFGEGIYNSYFN